MQLFICTIFLLTCSSYSAHADNGHLIGTANSGSYRVAVFAEPWPARVGEIQLQYFVTDNEGALVRNEKLLQSPLQIKVLLDEPGMFTYEYTLFGKPQQSLVFEVLPKANFLIGYWQIWLFLIFGLIFIILREILAKKQTRRYPSL